MYVPITTFNIGYPRERPLERLPLYYSTDLRKSKRKFQLFSCRFYTDCTMDFCIKLIFIQPYVSSKDTLCYLPLLFHAFPFILSFFEELRPTYYITPSPKRKPRSSRLLDKPAASDYNTNKEFADVLFSYFSHQLRERIFSWNQKQNNICS